MMFYKVRVAVHEIADAQECPNGHVPGQSWLFEDTKTQAGICGYAYCVLHPVISMHRNGWEHEWYTDKDVNYLTCPDPKRRVVFEVRRLKEE